MRVAHISFDESEFPPILKLVIHGAPHRRDHIATIKAYRTVLLVAARSIGILEPIDYPIDLWVTFVNPTSPDNGNLYLALERAMDSKSLGCAGLLTDDSLIQENRCMKFFSNSLENAYGHPDKRSNERLPWKETVRLLRNSA